MYAIRSYYEAVVFALRLSVLGLTRRPKWQATSAIRMPNTPPFASAMIRFEAGTVRFRPVMLTAITTILGLLPMAVGVSFDFFSFSLRNNFV